MKSGRTAETALNDNGRHRVHALDFSTSGFTPSLFLFSTSLTAFIFIHSLFPSLGYLLFSYKLLKRVMKFPHSCFYSLKLKAVIFPPKKVLAMDLKFRHIIFIFHCCPEILQFQFLFPFSYRVITCMFLKLKLL